MLKTVCPSCGFIVDVRHVNNKYTRKHHHGRNKRQCIGSFVPIPFEAVSTYKEKKNG